MLLHRFLLLSVSLLGPGVPGVGASTPVSAADAARWREDLKFLAQALPATHKDAFHKTPREQFEGAVQRLDQRIPALTRPQIIMELARLVALVGDGHTRLDLPQKAAEFRAYPVKFYVFTDGLYLIAAHRDYSALVGGRVARIGKVTAEEALSAAASATAHDNDMGVKAGAPALLSLPEALNGLGLTENMEQAQLVVEKGGRQVTAVLKPVPAAPGTPLDGWVGHSPDWVDARDPASPLPLWLKDPANIFWYEYLPEKKTVYLQFNAVYPRERETPAAFFRSAMEFGEKNGAEKFAIDMRLNTGGNNGFCLPMVHGFIRSDAFNQRGRLFTIIGRQTFSAAQNCANLLEKHTNTLFVGEPTGASPNSYGDATPVELPNSKLVARVSTLWWQDMDPRDTRPWRAPDLAAEMSFADYRTGRDPALEAILGYRPQAGVQEQVRAAVEKNDLGAARAAIASFRQNPENKYVSAERELNFLGYELLRNRQPDPAVAVFQLAVEAYPDSFNAYDSLGEAYMVRGDRELAIKNYQKSLDLNPGNGNARVMLRRLTDPTASQRAHP